jgi:Tol biopolymer transport system component
MRIIYVMKPALIFTLFLSIILTACGPSKAQIQSTIGAAIVQTQKASVPTQTAQAAATQQAAQAMQATIDVAVAQTLVAQVTPTPQVQNSYVGKIAFSGSGSKNEEDIWVVNADGSDLQDITNSTDVYEYEPRWSWDGRQIVFTNLFTGNLFIINADGSGRKQITFSQENKDPSWSPDGEKIVYVVNGEPAQVIQVLDLESQIITKIYTTTGYLYNPAYSPDGQKIVFSEGFNLFIMDATGGHIIQITHDAKAYTNPVWSPDGKRIIFNGQPGPGSFVDLFVINADGSGLTNITNSQGYNQCPSWSPDGRKIAFASDRDGNKNTLRLFIANADGSDAKMVVDMYANDTDWQPGLP